jgi:hypothetical protein
MTIAQHLPLHIFGLPKLFTMAEGRIISETEIQRDAMPEIIHRLAVYLSNNGTEAQKAWVMTYMSKIPEFREEDYALITKFQVSGGIRDLTNIQSFSHGDQPWVDFSTAKSPGELLNILDTVIKPGARYGVDWDFGDVGPEEGNTVIKCYGEIKRVFQGKNMVLDIKEALVGEQK